MTPGRPLTSDLPAEDASPAELRRQIAILAAELDAAREQGRINLAARKEAEVEADAEIARLRARVAQLVTQAAERLALVRTHEAASARLRVRLFAERRRADRGEAAERLLVRELVRPSSG